VSSRFLSRRPLVLAAAGAAIVSGATLGTPHASAAGGPNCLIKGTAHITPGLTTNSHAFTDTFSGTFSNCQGGGVKSAHVSESGRGSGSCASSTTAGVVSVVWNNGKTSRITITTKSAGAELLVTGTVTSGSFAGSSAKALLSFIVNPALCAKGGASSLSFNGAGSL
jgi:hypothetical protein